MCWYMCWHICWQECTCKQQTTVATACVCRHICWQECTATKGILLPQRRTNRKIVVKQQLHVYVQSLKSVLAGRPAYMDTQQESHAATVQTRHSIVDRYIVDSTIGYGNVLMHVSTALTEGQEGSMCCSCSSWM